MKKEAKNTEARSPGENSSFKCQLICFSEVCRLSKFLAEKVRVSGFRPDLIIAIGRGGYVPARLVSDFLLFKDLTSMKIEHYGRGADMEDKAVIRFPLSVDIRGKKVLIVDDVTDTGQTLELAVEYARGLKPTEIRTAVLQHKICSSFVPDYYAHRIRKWRWIIYPWAVYEDLVGFTEKILEGNEHALEGEPGLDLSGLLTELHKRYGLEVKEMELLSILKDLTERGEIECIEEKGSLRPVWKICGNKQQHSRLQRTNK